VALATAGGHRVIDFLRAFVRPFIAYTGWCAVVGLGAYLTVRFASEDIAQLFIGALLGTVATTVGHYIRDRVKT